MKRTKVCNVCNKRKPITEFSVNPHNKDGYQNYCKTCKRKLQREYYQKHKRTKQLGQDVFKAGKYTFF